MPSRLIINGRMAITSRGWNGPDHSLSRPGKRERVKVEIRDPFTGVPTGRYRFETRIAPVSDDFWMAIPAGSSESLLRSGTTYHDRSDNVVYAVLPKLRPEDGWATSAFWQDRWKCTHDDVCMLVREGLLDAAIEHVSQVRRFRCRDERLVFESKHLKKVARRNAVPPKQALKRAPLKRKPLPQKPKKED